METVALQAPLPVGFPRQEYWTGLPFPFLGDPLNPGIEPESPALVDGFFTTEPSGKSKTIKWMKTGTVIHVNPQSSGILVCLSL